MEKRWTVRELARATGVSQKSIRTWLSRQSGWERISGRWQLDEEQATKTIARFEDTRELRTPSKPLPCKVESCTRRGRGDHGLCQMHYQRRARTGSTERSSGGDWQAAKTHCPAGHPYVAANIYRFPSDKGTRRRCRQCRIQQSSKPKG